MDGQITCEKMHASIPAATCIGRQTRGINIASRADTPCMQIPPECRDCPQGRAVLEVRGAAAPERKERIMKQDRKRPCRNCGRIQTIVGYGCCYTCYHAGQGLTGEKKAAALGEVKRRIESGEVKTRGQDGSRKLPQPAAHKAPAAAHKGTASGLPPAPAREGFVAGELATLLEPVREIPVTLRLNVEISVRIV